VLQQYRYIVGFINVFTHSSILSSLHLSFNRPKGRGIYPKGNKGQEDSQCLKKNGF